MPGEFPKLRTNAIAQYPAIRTIRFQNQVLPFLDGKSQRYRNSGGPLREWEIRLDQLDEREMAAIEQFFSDNQGESGKFSFTDPWDGQVYANCSFSDRSLVLTSVAEMRSQTGFRVRQNGG